MIFDLNENNKSIQTYNSYMVILEAENKFIKNSKEFFLRIKELIKELWEKFRNKIDVLFKKDTKWIENNKDQLLELEVPNDFKFEIFPYWKASSIISTTKIMDFTDDAKFLEALKDDDTFRETYFKSLYLEYKKLKDVEWVEGIKDIMRGGPSVTITKNDIKTRIREAIDYCLNYGKLSSSIKLELDKITKVVDKASIEASKSSTLQNKTVNDEKKDAISGVVNASYTFEEIYLLGEVGETDLKAINDKNFEYKKQMSVDKNSMSDKDTSKASMNQLDAYRKYSKLCQEIVSAKMTIAEERFNQYMKFIYSLNSYIS